MSDLIDRQAATDAMKDMYRAAEKWLRDATDDVTKARAESCMASLVEIKLRTEKLPAVQPDHVADVSKKVEAKDCISRQAAIDTIMGQPPEPHYPSWYAAQVEKIPAAQPDHTADIGKKVERKAESAQNTSSCAHENDLVFRKAAIEAINGMIDRFERLLADIRESKGDDSVCGMCEYDGAYMGQSGDWCNECPGFDKDDCFKLSDRCRKRWMGDIVLPSAQPEPYWIPCSERMPEEGQKCLVYDKAIGFRVDTYIGHGNPYNLELFVRDYEAWIPIPKLTGGDVE